MNDDSREIILSRIADVREQVIQNRRETRELMQRHEDTDHRNIDEILKDHSKRLWILTGIGTVLSFVGLSGLADWLGIIKR